MDRARFCQCQSRMRSVGEVEDENRWGRECMRLTLHKEVLSVQWNTEDGRTSDSVRFVVELNEFNDFQYGSWLAYVCHIFGALPAMLLVRSRFVESCELCSRSYKLSDLR